PELLDYLIDNVLIEQHLLQMQIKIDKPEVDKRIDEMRAELKKQSKELEKVLQEMRLTEAELRDHIAADLRWDKYATGQATDKALHELFDQNKDMFDGSMVHARHILLTPPPGDAKAAEAAQAKLLTIKKNVEDYAAGKVAQLPPNSDNLAK